MAAAERGDVDDSAHRRDTHTSTGGERQDWITSTLQSVLSSVGWLVRGPERKGVREPPAKSGRAWTELGPNAGRNDRGRRRMIASTTADMMATDSPIAVDAPMAIADDVSVGAQRDPAVGGAAAEVDEQQLRRSREIWEHVREDQYEGIHRCRCRRQPRR